MSRLGHAKMAPSETATDSKSVTWWLVLKSAHGCFAKVLHRPALAIVISIILLFLGVLGIKTASDRTVPRHRAADRHGFHFLSRRQRQCPGRIGSDSARAIHQRRPEHALHYLLRHQCRRGGDHHLLRAGHGPEHQCRERAKPGQHRAVPASAPGGARGDPRQPGRAEHADVREHLQHGSKRRPERPFQLCQRLRHAPAQADQGHGHPQESRQPHLCDAGLAESRPHARLQRCPPRMS